MSKQYSSQTELHKKILEGVDILADNVASTLGPRGRNVILQEKGKRPITTKDGVTVAKAINLFDANENLGAQLVKEAASGAAEIAGDGTTTATVLAYELFKIYCFASFFVILSISVLQKEVFVKEVGSMKLIVIQDKALNQIYLFVIK